MNSKPLFLTSLSAAVLLGLSACGGSSSGTTTPQSANTTSGPITAFGSVIVNGKEYLTNNATIMVEGKSANESDLSVGMMVTIVKDSSGNAAAVHFDDDVEGVVTSGYDGTSKSIEVMGLTVTTDANTIFESKESNITDFTMIVLGNVVEVSGYYSTASSTIVATRVEVKALKFTPNGSDKLEVKGTVSNLTSTTFTIGNMVVDFNNADLTDLPNGLSNDLYVEVQSLDGLNGSGELIASKVELQDEGKDDHQGDEDDEYELKGKVMSVDAATNSFVVNNQTIYYTDATKYDDGSLSDLVVGALVEVEGHFGAANENGVSEVIADEIEFEDMHTSIELTDTIAKIVTTDTNVGTITLTGGTEIDINNDTIMKDSSSVDTKHFNLGDLAEGDRVEIHYYSNGGTNTATKLERHDPL